MNTMALDSTGQLPLVLLMCSDVYDAAMITRMTTMTTISANSIARPRMPHNYNYQASGWRIVSCYCLPGKSVSQFLGPAFALTLCRQYTRISDYTGKGSSIPCHTYHDAGRERATVAMDRADDCAQCVGKFGLPCQFY